jgi:catechol 2,3-dioxygenase-like lactoylglutathione lyase family enzyme
MSPRRTDGFDTSVLQLAGGQASTLNWRLGARMNINGIAHIQITVSRFELCVPFYEKLFELFGMKIVYRNEMLFYGVGARTGLAVTRCQEQYQGEPFIQGRIGLHHICFRARSREDVDEVHAFLQQINATIVRPPADGPWAPGYYSVLFEDPDGIRLEVNYVPGKGNLDPNIDLPRDWPVE